MEGECVLNLDSYKKLLKKNDNSFVTLDMKGNWIRDTVDLRWSQSTQKQRFICVTRCCDCSEEGGNLGIL